MVTAHTLLVIVALVLFALSFFGVGSRFNLVAGGLFAWLAAFTFFA